MVRFFLSFLIIAIFLLPTPIYARVSVQDQVNAQLDDYQTKVSHYSPEHQQSLTDLSNQIADINKKRTDQLEQIMLYQGELLDNYQNTHTNRQRTSQQLKYFTPRDELASDSTEQARYWITYAHEAVAYQAAKHYIFNLTGESNIKSDALRLINQYQSDMESTRQKVIHAQQELSKVLKS